jgi:hypothetical protein
LAETPQAIGIKGGDVFVIDDDLPAARGFQAVDQAQQGTFASPGVADQTKHLAVFNAQAGGVQGRNFLACHPIGFMDVMKLDHLANLVGRGKNSAQRQDAHRLIRTGWISRARILACPLVGI